MNFILTAVLVLGAIALASAMILYVCSKKFAVKEDPRLGKVAELLPGANCGGCGFPGCSGLAGALIKAADAGSIENLNCPVGGNDVMNNIADLLGITISNSEAKVAVIKCNGTCDQRPRISSYDGLRTCAAMHAACAGETWCGYGCLGCGDCVSVCQFGAININKETGLPEVDENKCEGCNACVKACPRSIIELRKKGPKGRRVYVRCVNKDKGATAIKACKAACIGCGKCFKECKFEAITIEKNLSYIDPNKCRLCRKCIDVCPTSAIISLNFPAPSTKSVTMQNAIKQNENPANAPKEEKEITK
ncbi:Fe-S cluster domain-containing protein [Prevotella sp. OH937_COT-195]|uniref:Fe-S cluster domain-containing protein n=1 Tax=Prevotella sp. OH937_COT-195 TaxID=2491051 RepID=UPI000F64E11B|nr:Fe-S cluster domain-containing protein [Prevotella sp. OH937_COT-195]RRC97866.1 Fe-S cluster domain-containing protein [Prevotella sp. OH937_COT-195]